MIQKRLAILTQYFPPEIGAPQNRLFETAQGLKAAGWEILIITAMPNYPTGKIFSGYRNRFSKRDTQDSLTIKRYWLYPSNSKRRLPRIVSMLSFCFISLFSVFALKKFEPAFILTESPPLPLGLTGIILSRITGAKHLLNVSDLWPLSALELGFIKKGKFYSVLTKFEQMLYKKSFACLGQSEGITRALTSNGARRSLFYSNGVDTSRFYACEKSGYKPLDIIYAGLLGVAQGMLELIKNLCFKSGDAILHIYGEGPEKEAIVTYLNASGREDVKIYPAVSRDEIPELLCRFHLTIVNLAKPIDGAVPSKIYEAMAAGLPIIFAGGEEGASIINHHGVGWTCEPGNYKKMQQILNELEIHHLNAASKNCLLARELFDRKIQLKKLDDFLTSFK